MEDPARGILTAERVFLNFLGHLSGIATVTRNMVRSLPARSIPRLACTRKTLPGLRAVQKYAVHVGSGASHRQGLGDAVMIKDNHRQLVGSLGEAVRRARAVVGHTVKIEVEVDTLEQLAAVLEARADIVLLDNMDSVALRQAVERARDAGTGTITETSGGITPETAAEIAATAVDLLSMGWCLKRGIPKSLVVPCQAEDRYPAAGMANSLCGFGGSMLLDPRMEADSAGIQPSRVRMGWRSACSPQRCKRFTSSGAVNRVANCSPFK